MKYIKLFENFDAQNIDIEDVIRKASLSCIKKYRAGWSLLAPIL